MSAERLREAARVLRERAEAAEPGPWSIRYQSGTYGCLGSEASNVTIYGFHPDHHGRSSEYIATVAPPFALAVADWLDAVEVLWSGAEFLHDPDGDPLTFGESIDSHAVAIADAILGDRG